MSNASHAELMQQLNGESPDRDARELRGVVSTIIWQSTDGDAVIARLHDRTTVKGPMIPGDELAPNVTYRFMGRWKDHPKHGRQFEFATFVKAQPHSRPGVIKYLVDEATGIGAKRAAQLWDHFRGEAVEVLRATPQRVVAAGILTEEQAAEASRALQACMAMEATRIDLFGLLAGRGFPGRLIQQCIDEWGARAAWMIRANPFALLVNDFAGCGFKRTDRLYLDLGGRRDKLKRQMLCAWNSLREDTTGHTWHRQSAAVEAVSKNCSGGTIRPEHAIQLGIRGGWLERKEDPPRVFWIAESEKARAERSLADNLRRLSGRCGAVRWPTAFPDDLGLTPHQLEKVLVALSRPVGILAGTPGTGKTFTAAAVVRQLVYRSPIASTLSEGWGLTDVAVCAPTGKASVRVQAAMKRYGTPLGATTIHRLLGVTRAGRDGKGWGFEHNAGNPLPYRFVLVDETSMCDVPILASLLEACADGTHILFVGDPYQLPPVGHGAPLRDFITAEVPVGELTEIKRQGGEPNTIVTACSQIKDGKRFDTFERFDPAAGHNLKFVECDTPQESIEALRGILRQFRQSGKFDPVWDVQVLVAVNENGPLARVELNRILQGELNAAGRESPPNPFRIDDKIICLKNGWAPAVELVEPYPPGEENSYRDLRDHCNQLVEVYVANGEVGAVRAVGPKLTIAQFDEPHRLVRIPAGKAASKEAAETSEHAETASGSNYALAYAITGHKSQGSEWPVVIVMVDPQAGFVASREWVYTCISRASKLCILIGQRAIADKQCKTVSLGRRKTFLAQMLNPTAAAKAAPMRTATAPPAPPTPATPEPVVEPPQWVTSPFENL